MVLLLNTLTGIVIILLISHIYFTELSSNPRLSYYLQRCLLGRCHLIEFHLMWISTSPDNQWWIKTSWIVRFLVCNLCRFLADAHLFQVSSLCSSSLLCLLVPQSHCTFCKNWTAVVVKVWLEWITCTYYHLSPSWLFLNFLLQTKENGCGRCTHTSPQPTMASTIWVSEGSPNCPQNFCWAKIVRHLLVTCQKLQNLAQQAHCLETHSAVINNIEHNRTALLASARALLPPKWGERSGRTHPFSPFSLIGTWSEN